MFTRDEVPFCRVCQRALEQVIDWYAGPRRPIEAARMHPVVDLEAVWNFATALLIGALLGIERERHKREHDEQTIGGLRTFILFALIGALGGWLTLALDSPWILAAALVASLAPVLAGYVMSARTQPDALGLTTELAAVRPAC